MITLKKLPIYFDKGYILTVDDEPNMRRTITNLLRHIGIRNVVEANSGNLALAILKNREHPALTKLPPGSNNCMFLLVDWMMPKLSGIDFLQEVRGDNKLENIPALIITAYRASEYVARASEVGINGYLIKPFNAESLEEKMFNIVKQRINPPKHIQLIDAAKNLEAEGNNEDALKIYSTALDCKPDSARILVLQGELLEKIGEKEKAQNKFKRAVELNPQYLKAHVAMATYYLNAGQEAEARDSLEMALEISPNNADRQTSLGSIYLKNGELEKAGHAFGKAAIQNPEKCKRIGDFFLEEGHAVEAEGYFRKAIPSKETNIIPKEKDKVVETYNRLGIALRKQGKWQDAVSEYEKAVNIDSRNEALFFNIGKAYLEGKKIYEAKTAFRKALSIDANFEEAREALQNCDDYLFL